MLEPDDVTVEELDQVAHAGLPLLTIVCVEAYRTW